MTEYSLAIIPCTGQKDPDMEEGPAEEIWVGAHFQYTLAHVEMMYDKVLVLSYKYGLISPSQIIETYDIDLRYAKPREKIRWWFVVRDHIIKIATEDPPLLVGLYTGSFFRDRVTREFVKNGVDQIITPWEGKGIGLRQAAVFDAVAPFEIERARNHEYKIDLTSDGTPTNKYLPPSTGLVDEIVWE
jgi:hypothetical protein